MDRARLAATLVDADAPARRALLARHRSQADPALARALKTQYDESKARDPGRAGAAALALQALAEAVAEPEIRALADWTAGMAALQVEGQATRALPLVERAAAAFERLGLLADAAATELSAVYALALLGRYDEAQAHGLAARDVFLGLGDAVAAGKVEQNLGNLHYRRDDYAEAERYYCSARDRFAAAGVEAGLLARAENNLGNALMQQHRVREAAEALTRALAGAEAAGLEVTQAEIEDNLGCLALVQGRYRDALDLLERSRRRRVALGMPHHSATVERQLGDAYLELNLAPEAAAMYDRAVRTFEQLGMRADQAGALTARARAWQALGRTDDARAGLAQARALYEAEGNSVGRAMVRLAEGEVGYGVRDYVAAAQAAADARAPFASAGAWGRALSAAWLRGDALRALGCHRQAGPALRAALRSAERHGVPQVAQRCHTSLGLLARTRGDHRRAEAAFCRAIALVEELRAPLPAEEFRASFVANKLVPYAELARLCLDQGRPAQALGYVERARSRALLDVLGGVVGAPPRPRDSFEAGLLKRVAELREELNWLYTQLRQLPANAVAATRERLEDQVRQREAATLDLTRQLHQRGNAAAGGAEPLDLPSLQAALGASTALVEYFSLDGELLAFVVTDDAVEVVRGLGTEEQATAAVQQLRFQVDALRHGAAGMRRHLDQLVPRARHYLRALDEQLLRPLEGRLAERRLVVVPHRALHYVPFHALYDGATHLVERREVVYAPSAGVLRHCLERPRRPLARAALVGVAEAATPRVHAEVQSLAPLFPRADVLLDERATLSALRELAPRAEVLHLACHGQFRPDSPLFSSLRLGDGWLTVADAAALDLQSSELVTLSACETGVSAVAPGDELMGLARGFLSAGTPALVVSLWTVDDDATAELMGTFYRRLSEGQGPAAALRQAQRTVLAEHPHPFFWAPFGLVGRW